MQVTYKYACYIFTRILLSFHILIQKGRRFTNPNTYNNE